MRTVFAFLLATLPVSALAQDDEVPAQLSIHWNDSGDEAFVWFIAEDVPDEELLLAASEGLGCDTLEPSAPDLGYLEGSCFGLLHEERWAQSARLDLRRLGETLLEHDLESLFVTVSHEGLPLVRLTGVEWDTEETGWVGGTYVFFDVDVRAVPESVFVEWGYDEWRIQQGLVVLVVIFLAPIGWTLLHRRRVLARTDFDENAGWFAYWRRSHWLSLSVCLAWILCLVTYSFWGVLGFLLSGAPPFWHHASALTLLIFPPLVVTTICQWLSIPVLDHLRRTKGVGRRLVRASLLASGVSWLPLLLVALGVLTVFDDLRLGLGLIVSSVLVRLALMALLARDEDFMPHAVTVGELRDRLFALAKTLGVDVKQLYVLPAVEARLANAFAVQGGNVILTDFLLRNLDKREVDGIVGHELAHLRHHHPLLLTVSFLASIGVVVALLYSAPFFGLPLVDGALQVVLAAAAGVLSFLYVSRRFELTADADAVLLTGDHEAMIRGLSKLTRANLLPRSWGRLSGWLLTHPSLEERAKAIAARSNLTDEQVQRSLDPEAEVREPYRLPEGVGSKTVYSTRFKTRIVTQNSLALIAFMVIFPAVVAFGVESFEIAGGLRWLVLGAGAVLGPVLIVFLADRLSGSGQPLLRRQLSSKLANEGVDTRNGVFVGYAPHVVPRLYENFVVWDVGFVFFDGDRIVYLGDHARFQIPRASVERVELQDAMPSWRNTKRVYVRAGGRDIAWTIPNLGSVSKGHRATKELFETLERWRAESAERCDVTFPENLPAPQSADVTSEPVRSAVAGNKVLSTVMMVGVTAVLANALFALDFVTTGWYVVATAILSSLVLMVPALRYKERAA